MAYLQRLSCFVPHRPVCSARSDEFRNEKQVCVKCGSQSLISVCSSPLTSLSRGEIKTVKVGVRVENKKEKEEPSGKIHPTDWLFCTKQQKGEVKLAL